MLTGEELYVVLKLTSGEQVMAVLSAEDEEYVELVSPMCIKTIPVLQTGKEHITAAPLCQFTSDTTYIIAKKDIMFVKKMHHIFIPHYQRIVSEHEDTAMFQPAEESRDEKELEWDDANMSVEEAKKRISMLQGLVQDETDDYPLNFIPGNDTIN